MASLSARNVARQVVETLGAGKIPNVTKIAIENGYTPTTARSGSIQNTVSYKDEIQSTVSKMERIRDRVLYELSRKDLSTERADTLINAMKSLTHDIQLLSGGKTENVSVDNDRMLLLGIVQSLKQPVDTSLLEVGGDSPTGSTGSTGST